MKLKPLLLLAMSCWCGGLNSQTLSYTKEEKNILAEHEGELMQFVNVVCEDAFTALRIKFRVNNEDNRHLMRLVCEREYRKYARNFIDDNAVTRVREKMRIDSLFQDSIDALLIPYNHQISGENISMALQLSEHFKLSNKKHRYLMDKALAFARKKRRDPHVWYAREEIDAMKKVLSRKQIETVINEKNYDRAHLRACQIWNDLEKAGLSEELDSATQMYLLDKYFTLDMFYRDYFVGDDVTMRNNLDDLYRQRPRGIKMHEAMRTRGDVRAAAKDERKKKVGDTFAW